MEAIGLETYKPYSMSVTLDGKPLVIAEIDVDGRKRLDAWIRANVPHPLEAIKPRLEGLAPDAVRGVVAEAAKDGLRWPPRADSPAGFQELVSRDEGIVEMFKEGLAAGKGGNAASFLKNVEPDAKRLFVTLDRMAHRGETSLAMKMLLCIMGKANPDADVPTPDESPEPDGESSAVPEAE